MSSSYDNILNPVGIVRTHTHAPPGRKRRRGRTVVGLLDNSKPNVALFLEAIEEELDRSGDYDIVNIIKPRSAGPCPDLDALASRCDFVVNAVAD